MAATLTGPPAAASHGGGERRILLFTGTMPEAVRITLEEYGVERLEPGDVLIANDPYRTGTHLNDLLSSGRCSAAAEIVAIVNLKAHKLDMGGRCSAASSVAKQNLYEDGLVFSPRRSSRPASPCARRSTSSSTTPGSVRSCCPDMQTIGT